MPVSTIRLTTEHHAQCLFEQEQAREVHAGAAKAGFGPGSRLHAVGDGAPWIANQVKARFGTQGTYLVDFFHTCEYLGAAAPA